jgi:hypothetical protein
MIYVPLAPALTAIAVVVLLAATFLGFRGLTRWLTADDAVEIDAMTRDGQPTRRHYLDGG